MEDRPRALGSAALAIGVCRRTATFVIVRPVAMLTAVLCVLSVAACGGVAGTARVGSARTGSPSSTGAPAPSRLNGDGDGDGRGALARERAKPDADGDSDNEGGGYYDWDDSNVLAYGHPASVAAQQAADSAVERYYAAAIRADGASACRLLSANVVRTTLREFGPGAGPLALGGSTCAAVMSKLLQRLRAQIAPNGHAPVASVVRGEGPRTYVLLSFQGARPDRYTLVRRERGAWRVDSLLDTGLP